MIRVAAKAIKATIVPFLLLWAPSQAHAATAYELSASFGAGTLNSPQRIAVDQNTGNLFAVSGDTHEIRVYKPTENSLELLTTFGDATTTHRPVGVAIDRSTGSVYVTRAGRTSPAPVIPPAIVKFVQTPGDPPTFSIDPDFVSPTQGFGTGQFGGLGAPNSTYRSADGGIAVDPLPNPATGEGNILIADPTRNLVHAFTSEGAPANIFPNVLPVLPKINTLNGAASGGAFAGLRDIAVDSTGDILIASSNGEVVRTLRFSREGDFKGVITGGATVPGGTTTGVGMVLTSDHRTGELFSSGKGSVAGADLVQQFENDARRWTLTHPSGAFNGAVHGLAVMERTPSHAGRLYVAAASNFILSLSQETIQIFEDVGELAEPPVVEIDSEVENITAKGATVSGLIDGNGFATTWRVRFREVGASEWIELPAQDLPDGSGAQPVIYTIQAMEPNKEYEFSIAATNEGGSTVSSAPHPTFRTLSAPPVVQTSEAWSISSTKASLVGEVNPLNTSTQYFVEYGPIDGELTSSPAEPAGSGNSSHEIAVNVTGLLPATTYRFRVVAENETGQTAEGDWATFETRAAADSELPVRGYELVSPPDTNGIAATPWLSSPDGERLAYTTFIPSPGATSGTPTYRVSIRQDDGSWERAPFNGDPPNLPGYAEGGLGVEPTYSSDLKHAAFGHGAGYDPDDRNGDPASLLMGGVTGYDTYLRDLQTGAMTWVSRDPRIPVGTPQTDDAGVNRHPRYVSSDGRQVLFLSKRRLLDEDVANPDEETLYEWNDGQLRVVGILPGSTTTGSAGTDLGSSGVAATHFDVRNAVSADGKRIVFRSGARLYIRIEGSRTVDIGGAAGGRFVGADSGVETVLFLRDQSLFAYDVSDESTRAVAALPGGAGIGRVLGFSDDADTVYFASSKVLADGADSVSSPYLYVATREDGEADYHLRFISRSDPNEDPGGSNLGWNQPAVHRELRTSPDGALFAFRSRIPLVPGRKTNGRPQVFVYELHRDSLSCVSCPEDGSNPPEHANLVPSGPRRTGRDDSPSYHRLDGDQYGPIQRNIATNGSVFFQTATPLIARDSNSTNDVYEWRGGELQLVSAGTGDRHSMFGDASVDGSTVFFRSAAKLVPGDLVAGVQRTYAARVGGGYRPPSEKAPCAGSDCRRAFQAESPGVLELGTRSAYARVQTVRRESTSKSCRAHERALKKAQLRVRRIERGLRREKGSKAIRLQVLRKRASRRLKKADRRVSACRRAAR